MTIRAYAKINFTLEVIGKYREGYHQIVSVMQAIDLCDTLTFQMGDCLELACNLPELSSPQNLVFQAARLLQQVSGAAYGAKISLSKSIPLASGLGGGSSDAAVTLRALNQLWELGLPLAKLKELGMSLGSDVPFFLGTPTALIEGRGEKLTPLPSPSPLTVVLLMPPLGIPQKTRQMYASLTPVHFTTGQMTQRLVGILRKDGEVTSSLCYNVFEGVACSLFPSLEEYRGKLFKAGATSVHLSGSGPVLFTVAEDRAKARDIYHYLKAAGENVYLTQTVKGAG